MVKFTNINATINTQTHYKLVWKPLYQRQDNNQCFYGFKICDSVIQSLITKQ
jgi:hypothetical protein